MNKPVLFDAHFHIIDPRFPLIPNQGYLPDAYSCEDYLHDMQGYVLCGGAVVSGSFQGFDQSYLLAALAQLGPDYVGVTQLPETVDDATLRRLNLGGVRALRFNLYRGGSADIRHLEAMAWRVYELLGWHVELYLDSAQLAPLSDRLRALPAVSIDHLGLSEQGFDHLLELAASGVRFKACGFGRVSLEVARALRELDAANPEALMFGSDLPGTRAPRPFQAADYQLLLDTLGETRARAVLVENARRFYRLDAGR